MGNGEYEFAQMLSQMENEVLALKTAHQRPLGTLNFFQSNTAFNVNINAGEYSAYFKISIKIAPPSAKPPILQAGWEIPSGFYDVTLINTTINSNYDLWEYTLGISNSNASAQTVPFSVGVVSSQPILEINWEYTNPWT